jgi:hypothetical protein
MILEELEKIRKEEQAKEAETHNSFAGDGLKQPCR